MVKIYLILTCASFLASSVFVVLYHRLARWRDSEFGQSLMTYQVCMTVLLGEALFQGITGSKSPVLQIGGLIVYAGVPCALMWRIVVLIRLQRSKHDDTGNGDEI